VAARFMTVAAAITSHPGAICDLENAGFVRPVSFTLRVYYWNLDFCDTEGPEQITGID